MAVWACKRTIKANENVNLHLYHQVFQLYNARRQFVLSLRLHFSVHQNQNMALNMMRLVRLLTRSSTILKRVKKECFEFEVMLSISIIA